MRPRASSALHAAIGGIGLIAPGLEGWERAAAVLRGETDYRGEPLAKHKLELLPANERRRATALIQLALRAVEDCLGSTVTAGGRHDELASVFACSGGDIGNLQLMCEQLARDPKGVSPTAFHNSVHNAVSGYWSIGGRSRAPSVSVSAHDASFLAGLLEALALVADREAPVLFAAYDAATPPPLFAKRAVAPDFALALLLEPALPGTPRLSIERWSAEGGGDASMPEAALEALRAGNPAARCLPLLRLIARAASGSVVLCDGELSWLARYQT